MTATQTTLSPVAAAQARLDAERAEIAARQAELDALIVKAFDAGESTVAYETERIHLRAKAASLDMIEKQLIPRREAEEVAAILATYEAETKTMATIYAQIAMNDKLAERKRAELRELGEQNTELYTQLQAPSARRSRLGERIRYFSLKRETAAINKRYAVPPYFG